MKAQQGWRAAGCDPQCSSWEGLTLARSPDPNPGNAHSLGLEKNSVPLLWHDPALHPGLQKAFQLQQPKE